MSMPEEERGCENTGAVRPLFCAQDNRAGGGRWSLRRVTAGHGKANMEIDLFPQAQEPWSNGTQTAGADILRNGIELKWLFPPVDTAYNYRQRIPQPGILSAFLIHALPRRIRPSWPLQVNDAR